MQQRFEIGHETLYETLIHIVEGVQIWSDLIHERAVLFADDQSPLSMDEVLERFDSGYHDFAAMARCLTDEGRRHDFFVDTLDVPPARKSFGGAIAHVITHNMHHRGEVLHMPQRLGVENLIKGDVLSWEAQGARLH